jgi:uncharacterized membrane protein YdjX (TVP38/TMEM64 family)
VSRKLILGIAALVLLAVLWLLFFPSAREFTQELGENIPDMIDSAGAFGPLVIILLLAAEIVASPLPSAPIALAAGAAYGHTAGAIYVAIGSELGSTIAFLIARYLGRGTVVSLLGSKAEVGLLGSQNALTLIVFSSRLLPFISFDAMSYAAGLSNLHTWRFLLATLAGILPASFLLAHFGSTAISGSFGVAEWSVLGLGMLTALPFLLVALKRGRKASGDQDGPTAL